MVEWCRFLEQLVNGSLEIRSPVSSSSLMVSCSRLLLHWRLPKHIRCQGTFFIAQGTMLIPSFGVGTLYSPSGDSLEGMETVEFKATVGMNTLIPLFFPHYSPIPCIPKSFDRFLLRHPRHPYHHLPHMLHPHQLLSFRNPASAGCDLRAVCRCLLRVGAWK